MVWPTLQNHQYSKQQSNISSQDFQLSPTQPCSTSKMYRFILQIIALPFFPMLFSLPILYMIYPNELWKGSEEMGGVWWVKDWKENKDLNSSHRWRSIPNHCKATPSFLWFPRYSDSVTSVSLGLRIEGHWLESQQRTCTWLSLGENTG